MSDLTKEQVRSAYVEQGTRLTYGERGAEFDIWLDERDARSGYEALIGFAATVPDDVKDWVEGYVARQLCGNSQKESDHA